MSVPRYSIIVPVYNRPAEVEELLESLTRQTYRNFEVLLVEDGSSITSQSVYERYSSRLTIQYFFKPNSGPGPSRNFGFQHARGENLVVFDSDCVIPPDYFQIVDAFLARHPLDVWGGPDRGHSTFTRIQQAMGYSMSSVLTTGGIRGGANVQNNFQPRSFNMGMTRKAYEMTKGFVFERFAEDIELSIRSRKLGLRVGLIPDAFVYHKRRTNFRQFFRQVSNFGMGRIHVSRAHKGAIKVTHWFPAVFLLGLVGLPLVSLMAPGVGVVVAGMYGIYFAGIFVDALRTTRSIAVAALAVPSAIVQLTGYGFGFLRALVGR